MKMISILDFRKNARRIIHQIHKGKQMVLTYRGKPVARFVPIREDPILDDDPFYRLSELADAGGKPMSNAQMERIIYGT
jgi:antitoxin (DNA-binding transcriptional repressor) of toxin-antitoxin stability system